MLLIKRFGKLEDLNGMAIYLASNESDYVTGQTFSINGGAWLDKSFVQHKFVNIFKK